MRVLFVCVFEFYLGGDHAKRVSMPPKHLACELERGRCTTRRVMRGAGGKLQEVVRCKVT